MSLFTLIFATTLLSATPPQTEHPALTLIDDRGAVSFSFAVRDAFYAIETKADGSQVFLVVISDFPGACELYENRTLKSNAWTYQLMVENPQPLVTYAVDAPSPLAHGMFMALDSNCSKTTTWHAASGALALKNISATGEPLMGHFALSNGESTVAGLFTARPCQHMPVQQHWLCDQ